MKLRKNDTAVLVIDYQEKLMPAMHNRDAFVSRTRVLLEGLKVLGIPAIVSEQYPQGLGSTIPEIKEVLGVVPYMAKTTFSCMDNAGIRTAIKTLNCNNIIICGSETHICVLQSAIDLLAMGKNVLIAEDCVGSRTEHEMQVALRRAEEEGARISTTETILFELLGNAQDAEFKTISKLIK